MIVSKELVENIVSKALGFPVILKEGTYFKKTIANTVYYNYCKFYQFDELFDFSGCCIAIEESNRIEILPYIMEIIISLNPISIDYNTAKDLSYGNNTIIHCLDGIYIAKDKFDRNIALVRVKESKAIPLVDIGQYLRIE